MKLFSKRIGGFTAVILAAQVTYAQNPPIEIAGGALDPQFQYADIYQDVPWEGSIPDTEACQLAAQYVVKVNEGDAEAVAALFSDDAVVLEPTREVIQGRTALDTFYAERLGSMTPKIVGVAYTGQGSDCMVALASEISIRGERRFALVSVDHFILGDDARFRSMVAFARPPREE